MAKSKSLLRVLNSILPFADFLYLLQLEEYYPGNYFKRTPRFFFRRNFQKRGKLDWTLRIKATFAVSVLLFAAALALPLSRIILIPLACILVPLWVGLANLIVAVPAAVAKLGVRRKAGEFVKRVNPNVKVVAVVGSFGKTTTKNFIYQLIHYNYKAQMVERNINTPVGIAQWLLKNLDKTAQVVLVEMDAYGAGEIAQSSKILPADVFVVTSISDQHISRFGDIKNTAAALLEIARFSKKGALCIVNQSTMDVVRSLGVKDLLQRRRVEVVPDAPEKALRREGLNERALALAVKVAEILGIPKGFILSNVKELIPPPRRHALAEREGYKVIDDSYNISLETAKYGVESAKNLASKAGLELTVITAGIPESGMSANAEYAKFLSGKVGRLVVLNSCFRKELVGNFSGGEVLMVEDMEQAWNLLKKRFRPEEVLVLIQPELTDLYY